MIDYEKERQRLRDMTMRSREVKLELEQIHHAWVTESVQATKRKAELSLERAQLSLEILKLEQLLELHKAQRQGSLDRLTLVYLRGILNKRGLLDIYHEAEKLAAEVHNNSPR